MRLAAIAMILATSLWAAGELETARDKQDRAALEKLAAQARDAAGNDAAANYRAAVAFSYLAQVNEELRDRGGVKRACESGIALAERAVSLKPNVAEHHRILGTLYGQIVPVNVLAALGYGKKAQDAIGKALELDPKSAQAHVSRGVGSYYLPAGVGGGTGPAIRDFQKAIELNPKSDDGYLWLGLALRKANRNAEARTAFAKSLELNPNRIWAKQQLDKTPAN
jgi:tetratricopeptide (TPR) repeat protein